MQIVPLIGMYAEMHFRFWVPFSRYFIKEPELIFDMPWRLNPGQQPTVFLIVKDAHLYPTHLKSISIEIFQAGKQMASLNWQLEETIRDRQKEFKFVLEQATLPPGHYQVLPHLRYEVAGKIREMVVDNYSGIRKTPLGVTVSAEPLPTLPGWVRGDTHVHTSLTTDQIEFGASPENTQLAAQLLGLDFLTATDHSYDLDDYPDDYLTNDPELKKWHQSRKALAELNQNGLPTIIPGEEISVANGRGATVHLLHYNDPMYHPGNGDSGEEWPKVQSELTIDDVLKRRSPETISVGAHTGYKFSWLQSLLLKRGSWESADHQQEGLNGVQILCGTPAYEAFHASRQLWIEALLQGYKLAVYGGSDGHGNFNRSWHVQLPLWSLATHEDQILGQSRTLLKSKSVQIGDLIDAMRHRRTALSTGPIGDMILRVKDRHWGIGDVVSIAGEQQLVLNASGMNTAEFGLDLDVSIYSGNLESRQETLIHHESFTSGKFEISKTVKVVNRSYYRLEISSEGALWPGIYVSSPIWIERKSTSV